MSASKRTDEPAAGAAAGEPRPGPSRRSVLQGAAGLAGAGLAASAFAGTLAAPAAAASAPARVHHGQAAGTAGGGEPVIVHVRDVRSGEMDVFAGTSRTRLHDPGLAAKLVHAAG